MNILQAMEQLKNGFRISREKWGENIYCMLNYHTKLIEVFEGTKRVETNPNFNTTDILANDWKIYIKSNGKRTFGDAIEHIKKGGKAKREGWNGKEQYITLATDIKCIDQSTNLLSDCEHLDIGSQAILFHGTRGNQIGWLASQSDMLANDWILLYESED